jgi:hypothetical protein
MKKFLTLFTVLFAATLITGGCVSKQKVEAEEELPYNRSVKKKYENKMTYSVFIPFMYEDGFYAYYALGRKISGPDAKGFYEAEFTNGPKRGEKIKTKNILLKVRQAAASDLAKGMVVLVNHWDPKMHNDNTPVDMWRKGVVYNLDEASDGLVMLEFPFDRNDFMATKETYRLDNVWLILDPVVKDPRIFL